MIAARLLIVAAMATLMSLALATPAQPAGTTEDLAHAVSGHAHAHAHAHDVGQAAGTASGHQQYAGAVALVGYQLTGGQGDGGASATPTPTAEVTPSPTPGGTPTPTPSTTPPSSPPSEPAQEGEPEGRGGLPVTGAQVGGMAVLGAGLLAAGIAMLAVRRRRDLSELLGN